MTLSPPTPRIDAMAYGGTKTFIDGTVLHAWYLDEPAEQLAHLCEQEGLPTRCEAKAESRRRELLGERLLLKRIFGLPAQLEHNEDLVPQVDDCQGYISVAHTRGYLCIAMNPDHAMGVDVERYGRRVLNVRDGFLNEGEKAWLSPHDDLGHLIAWTAKEAIFKTIGNRRLVNDYRENIMVKPFVTPRVGEHLQYGGAFGQEDFHVESTLSDRFLLTFTCARRNMGK